MWAEGQICIDRSAFSRYPEVKAMKQQLWILILLSTMAGPERRVLLRDLPEAAQKTIREQLQERDVG